jgi:signal peptidase I
MRSSRTRSLLVSAFVLALAGVGWFFLAPTQIGGSTRYVITHGISMEPLIHTGDLVLVRPANDYHVGEVVAYHSTLLNTVVLHRIIAIHDGHYTFKGDNNDFIDPTHPTRALLLGRMWLHIPHGGTVLDWVHKPWVAAALTGGVAMLLLFGGDQQRRRRRHRRGAQKEGGSSHPIGAPSYVANRALLVVAVVATLLFAALGVFALLQPTSSSGSLSSQYTQQLSFGYHGPAKQGSVYPTGKVTTGDPVYLQLVRQLAVTASYAFKTSAATQLHGSVRIRGTLSNSSGWSRDFWLSPQTRFSGDHGFATAQLNLSRLQALTSRVSSQIGAGGIYTLAIVPQVKLSGTVGGAPIATTDSAALDLSIGAEQLLSGTSAITPSAPSTGSTGGASTGSGESGLVHTTTGALLASSSSATKKLAGVPVRTVRWIALAGFVLFALLALLTGSREVRGSSDPVEQINHRYKHLIVPVSAITPDADHPPIEVRTIEALAQLAERSERLILHDHQDDVDNYLIDDQGTLFRFQSLHIRNTNGNGNRNGNGNGNGRHTTVSGGVAVGVAAAADTAEAAGAAGTNGIGGTAAADDMRPSVTKEPVGAVRTAPVAAAHEPAAPPAFVNGMAPLSDPVQNAQAIKLSDRVTPELMFDQEPRRPPVPDYTRWTRRPELAAGFTLGPLLTLLAWRKLRSRRVGSRPDSRPVEVDDQPFAQPERKRSAKQQPRGPGDRRRSDRRSN